MKEPTWKHVSDTLIYTSLRLESPPGSGRAMLMRKLTAIVTKNLKATHEVLPLGEHSIMIKRKKL